MSITPSDKVPFEGEKTMIALSTLKKVRKNLDPFLKQFHDCIAAKPSRYHFNTYIQGQLSDLERKSIEPIALQSGTKVRTLQEFIGFHKWDEDKVRARLREIIIRDHSSDDAIAVVDETSVAKKGNDTVGIKRQYCGSTGKKDNCVVSVHLGYAAGNFHTILDSDLYLPKDTWASDEELRSKARIPDDVTYRPKWEIALDQVRDADKNGVKFKWLVADELYGRASEFRGGVADLGMIYVVEIPRSIMGWTKMPTLEYPGKKPGRGRPLQFPRLAPDAPAPRRVDELWRRGGPSWETYHVKETENGPLVWEARHTRFIVSNKNRPREAARLIVARNPLSGEVKYFLSNAPYETPVSELLRIAFSRWRIERSFQDAKGDVGLDHFEVRRWTAVKRHLILTMISLLFLAKETEKLRGEKSELEHPSGSACRGGAA